MTIAKETLGFQAEVKQLLQLMIHSLYSNKEIFLRELISNASDAADKLRFEAIHHADWYESDPELKIKIHFDKEARTITIADNGIGMSREEAIANLGTIARSGTKEFFQSYPGINNRMLRSLGSLVSAFTPLSLWLTISLSRPDGQGFLETKAFVGNLKARGSLRLRPSIVLSEEHRLPCI